MLPNDIGNLTSITYLDRSYNALEGDILRSLGNLCKHLDLGKNRLSGHLPSELGQLKSLSYLSIDGNLFSGQIPISLGRIPSSSYLNIRENFFNQRLSLPYAGISSVIPAWFWTGSYLSVDLSHNQIIGNIPSLHSFDIYLGSNNFTGPLPQISSDRELTMLKLGNNNLTGHIPSSMGYLIWLGSLHLLNNRFSGHFPLPLKNCSSLVVLDLSEKEFTGSIPAWMGNFKAKFIDMVPGDAEITYTPGLMVLILHSNKFNGTHAPLPTGQLSASAVGNILGPIPLGLCNRTSLRFLDLSYNNFASPIPAWPGKGLEHLRFRGNKILGSFPETLGECKCLEHLDLGKNRLSGHLPSELGQLKSLSHLSIDGNLFSSQIPISLGGLSSLSYLNIRENFFNGIMSEKHLANLTSLEELDASLNLLTLQVSSNWTPPFQLTRLELELMRLKLGNNNLTGHIPSSMVLILSDCGLDSINPLPVVNFSSLTVLDLSENQFVSPTFDWFSSLGSLASLDLTLKVSDFLSNNFNGILPVSIRNLTSLVAVDLSNNALEGEIPRSLGEHCNLQRLDFYLDMSGNSLKGIVSGKHFANLTRLKYLHASSNSFTLQVGSDWNPPFQLEILKMGYWQLGPLFTAWLQTQKDQMDLDISRV
ncbi:unnamed protein product, partial [Vitis vinifera]